MTAVITATKMKWTVRRVTRREIGSVRTSDVYPNAGSVILMTTVMIRVMKTKHCVVSCCVILFLWLKIKYGASIIDLSVCDCLFSPPPVKPEGTIGLHSVCLSVCLSVRQSVCLSVTLVFRTFLHYAFTYLNESW